MAEGRFTHRAALSAHWVSGECPHDGPDAAAPRLCPRETLQTWGKCPGVGVPCRGQCDPAPGHACAERTHLLPAGRLAGPRGHDHRGCREELEQEEQDQVEVYLRRGPRVRKAAFCAFTLQTGHRGRITTDRTRGRVTTDRPYGQVTMDRSPWTQRAMRTGHRGRITTDRTRGRVTADGSLQMGHRGRVTMNRSPRTSHHGPGCLPQLWATSSAHSRHASLTCLASSWT